MISFKPIGNTIIVELDIENEKTLHGIILPHQRIEHPITGKVVAVGRGKTLSNGIICDMTCNVGDKVIFARFSGSEYELKDQKFLVLSEDDIMAIIYEGVVMQ